MFDRRHDLRVLRTRHFQRWNQISLSPVETHLSSKDKFSAGDSRRDVKRRRSCKSSTIIAAGRGRNSWRWPLTRTATRPGCRSRLSFEPSPDYTGITAAVGGLCAGVAQGERSRHWRQGGLRVVCERSARQSQKSGYRRAQTRRGAPRRLTHLSGHSNLSEQRDLVAVNRVKSVSASRFVRGRTNWDEGSRAGHCGVDRFKPAGAG
jgi:hypothetical protein